MSQGPYTAKQIVYVAPEEEEVEEEEDDDEDNEWASEASCMPLQHLPTDLPERLYSLSGNSGGKMLGTTDGGGEGRR